MRPGSPFAPSPAHLSRLLAALVVLLPGRVAAQVAGADSLAAMDVPALLAAGDLLHDQLLPLDALARFEEVVRRSSSHYEARWKAAREAVNVGMLAEDGDRKKEWFIRGEEHARAALAVRPDGVEARHWLSVALGRRALREGIRTRVRLAEEVRMHAQMVLKVDSLHDGAHHVLGQWNAEVRRLSGVERWIAGNVLGGETLDEASWEAALRHLERAVELAPGDLLHRLELARVYLDLDRDAEARDQLEEILALPALEPTDPLHKQAAQELLQEMG